MRSLFSLRTRVSPPFYHSLAASASSGSSHKHKILRVTSVLEGRADVQAMDGRP